jgi:hypothetical protein
MVDQFRRPIVGSGLWISALPEPLLDTYEGENDQTHLPAATLVTADASQLPQKPGVKSNVLLH